MQPVCSEAVNISARLTVTRTFKFYPNMVPPSPAPLCCDWLLILLHDWLEFIYSKLPRAHTLEVIPACPGSDAAFSGK